MKKVAVSACLLGEACRYDATDNKNKALLERLIDDIIVPFCPEAYAFGTPRPTMDLVETPEGVRALSNRSGKDLSDPVLGYAKTFFDRHPDIDLFIGKDRSPSCGVCSAKVYNSNKELIHTRAAGLMAAEAIRQGINAYDAETYMEVEDNIKDM